MEALVSIFKRGCKNSGLVIIHGIDEISLKKSRGCSLEVQYLLSLLFILRIKISHCIHVTSSSKFQVDAFGETC